MNATMNDRTKFLTKGDAIDIFARGADLRCTVEAMVPGRIVIAKTPDNELIVAVPSRLSRDRWVDIESPHDASKTISWSHDRQFEVGELVEIDLQVDGEKGGERKTVGVMRGEVLGVDAGATRFGLRDCPLYADGDDRRLKEKMLAALMTTVTNCHVRGIDD